jgi:hypothetical protein
VNLILKTPYLWGGGITKGSWNSLPHLAFSEASSTAFETTSIEILSSLLISLLRK